MPSGRKNRPSSEYLRYSGLAFQMVFVLLVGWWIGNWIDGMLGLDQPYIALSLSTLLLIGLFYKLYREVMGGK